MIETFDRHRARNFSRTVVVYIYFLRKIFIVHILKQHHEMIQHKNAGRTCKTYGKKVKKHVSDFSTLSIDDMKQRKNTNLFCWYKNTQQ